MRIQLHCFPCVLRMAINAIEFSNAGKEAERELIQTVLAAMHDYSENETSPEVIRRGLNLVAQATGCLDPYRDIKARDVETAEQGAHRIRALLDAGSVADTFQTALLISAIGNTLDSAISLGDELTGNIEREIRKPFAIYDGDELEARAASAKSVLVIGDNIGEVILDRFLFPYFPNAVIRYAVRETPTLNDASVQDVKELGYGKVQFLSSGSTLPGTLLDECSNPFREAFFDSDLVISKGLGNYETLVPKRDVFFLLKAKCRPISEYIGVQLNDYVCMRAGMQCRAE